MFYHLSLLFTLFNPLFNVFHYVSVRSIMALLTALGLSLIFGDWFIVKSKRFFRSKSREYTPAAHRLKDDMPTMGGILILMVTTLTILFWCNLSRPEVWIFLFGMLGYGVIGFLDDYNKIKFRKGISGSTKFVLQVLVATAAVLLWIWWGNALTVISFPFFKNLTPDFGCFFVVWAVFIIVGCSNAVNLTDGLDGLAISSLIANFAIFSVICFLAGHFGLSTYLNIPFAGSSEIAVVGSALIGASLGFLWYNTYPAQIFMGDVGSLALGAGLALMALMSKQEILLAISGGLFVVETLSVITQVLSFKFFGKRLFKMAPIHHHFELIGWPESKITIRFCIISLVLCLLALVTLKIR